MFVCVKQEEGRKLTGKRDSAWIFCCQHYTQHVCIGYILAVPTAFGIPSGHENRNFYYTLDILTGKISQRVSAEFDFLLKTNN